MAQTKYTYSIATDTANGILAADSLKEEISQSSITVAFDYISALGDVLDVFMKDALSAGDKTILDGLISDHAGAPLDGEPQTVQLSITTGLGVPLIATKKADGDSFTMISHNFCDSTTWADPLDSSWKVTPPAGKIYKVIKAEVQFSHDISMSTLPTPNKMLLNVMAGGGPVDQKEFKTIADVFDLGNGHSSTPAGVTIDGVPGMTTVFFEYYDAIVLRSDWLMEMVFKLNLDTQLGGTHCSVSAVVEPMNI